MGGRVKIYKGGSNCFKISSLETFNMFNLPLEMVYSVLSYLSYEDIIALENAFPELEEQVYDMKLKKGKQKVEELNAEMEMMKVKFRKRERELYYYIEMGVCYFHLKSATLRVYRKKKQEIEAKLYIEEHENIEDHENNEELVLKCYLCQTLFPTVKLAKSHLIDLSEYCQ